jgi:hypothetical protein
MLGALGGGGGGGLGALRHYVGHRQRWCPPLHAEFFGGALSGLFGVFVSPAEMSASFAAFNAAFKQRCEERAAR